MSWFVQEEHYVWMKKTFAVFYFLIIQFFAFKLYNTTL